MTIHKVLHPKSDVHRLYLPRARGGRGLISIKQCMESEENNLGLYVKNNTEHLIKAVQKAQIINTENCMPKESFKKNKIEEMEKTINGKALHGQFCRDMKDGVDKLKSWEWLRKGDLKAETEALIFAAQEQALRTNYIKHKIDKTAESPLCRLCSARRGFIF